jgi:hypothetical protein
LLNVYLTYRQMKSDILLDLPEAIARLVLVDWIGFKDVGRLDSAICNRASRIQFLTLVSNPFTAFTSVTSRYRYFADSELVLGWVVTRKAHLDGIIIVDSLLQHQNLLTDLLTVSGPTISWIKIISGRLDAPVVYQNALSEIVKRCPNFEHLSVRVERSGKGGMRWDKHLVALTKSCFKLTNLLLFQAPLSKRGLTTAIKHCKSLQRLSIVTPDQAIPADIALPTLKTINIVSSAMMDAAMLAIGQRCAKLETLTVFAQDCDVTDVGVRAVLQGCPLLKDTDVEVADRISVELRVELARRRNMTVLIAQNWWEMNDELARGVLRVSPNLTKVDFCVCGWLTDATLAVCAQHCPLVSKIALSGCWFVTDKGVCVLVSGLASSLRCVDLDTCPLLSDDVVLAIAKHCPLLEKFECTMDVSNAAVVKLAKGCPVLHHVYLYGTNVGDTGVTALATHCTQLQQLYLYCCPKVTMKGVRVVARQCQLLTQLGLPTHFSNDGERIRQLMPTTCNVRIR